MTITDTRVIINGVNVRSYLVGWEKNATRGKGSIKGMVIILAKTAEDVLGDSTVLNTKSVSVESYDDISYNYVFRGFVVRCKPAGDKIIFECADKLYETTKKTLTKSFDKNIDVEAGVISELFKSLINNYTSLTADDLSVQNTHSMNVLTKFVCKAVTVYDALTRLADSISWQFYYNPVIDRACFEPKGFVNQTIVLSTATNIKTVPEWIIDSDQVYNYIEVRGATQLVETTEIGQVGVTAGYTTSSVLLEREPVSVKVYADAASPPVTLRQGGKAGVSIPSLYDYSVDNPNKEILWNSATYSPSNNHYVKVDYSFNLHSPVVVQDDVSINDYELKSMVVHKPDIPSVDDAENYAMSLLDDYKNPITKTNLRVNTFFVVEAGQKVRVVDEVNGVDDFFIVERTRQRFPYSFDEIEIVSNVIDEDAYAVNINSRVKRLEEEGVSDDELLTHAFGLQNNIFVENRDVRTISADITGYFVLDHIERGELDAIDLEDSDLGTDTVIGIVQGGNVYKEYVYDDDYYDSANSVLVDWNTGTKTITITDVLYTEAIALGYAYTSYNLSFASITGTYTIEISGDGKANWQEAVIGTDTEFAYTDTLGVYLRITATTETIIENTSLPAIRLKLI